MSPCVPLTIATAAILCLASCGGGSGGTGPPSNNTPNPPGGNNPAPTTSVTVGNNDYTPDNIAVSSGATVTWRWDNCSDDGYGGQQCVPHSVTFDDGGSSAPVQSSGTFQRSFPTAGSYTYYCTSHGRSAMSGRVTVQ
jgi:plastocyanin